MAEEQARQRLYDYNANSNLVLKNRSSRRHHDEPSGEAQSLRNKVSVADMGARAQPTRAADLDAKLAKKRERDARSQAQQINHEDAALVNAADDTPLGAYRPTTRETRLVFEELLAALQRLLGDHPRDILHSAADEVLAIIKDPELTAPRKESECRRLLGNRLSKAAFTDVLRLCERIDDFETAMATANDDTPANAAPSGDIGVAVVFDGDSSDESDDELAEVVSKSSSSSSSSSAGDSDGSGSDSDANSDPGADPASRRRKRKTAKQKGPANGAGATDQDALNVHEIDAHWVQRELATYFPDAREAQELADKVLQALAEPNERACENQLVLLLEFDKFALIRKLLANRKKILYCTKLKRAASDPERAAIEREMNQDREPGGGRDILAMLADPTGGVGTAAGRSGPRRANAMRVRDADQEGNAQDSDEGDEDMEEEDAPNARAPRRLDLQALAFGAGDHTMTNKEVRVKSARWVREGKAFKEVHVPPLKPKPFLKDEKLCAIQDLPTFTHGAFARMTTLNRVQSRIMPAALHKDFNLLVCAPTGAGKTNVAMLTVLHEIGKFVDPSSGQVDTARMKKEMKIVYVAPMKALVQEVVQNFGQRLGASHGLTVRELSGDQQLSRAEIAQTQMIVTTPEKWDIVTRKAGERAYTQLVKLVIIDEIHLLHNERGAVLEAIIARAIRQQEVTQQRVRLVGISATLPNYKDVATFLRVPFDKGLFFFDNSFRPVPLQQQYIGITETKPFRRLQKANEICYDKIIAALENNPKDQVLVFVHSRKDTAATARYLRDLAEERDQLGIFLNAEDRATREILRTSVEEEAHNPDLKDVLLHGLAVHHAGLPRADRTLVEDLFKRGYIKALVCTATLAWGVNLPAHTVIIKGTQVYNPEKGRWTELSQLDILQMLGRAGRPQFETDTEGEGIIITSHAELQFYLSLLNEQLPVESQLIRRLADALNAEIVMGGVQSIEDGAHWLGYTYLYVRMLQSPAQYGIPVDEVDEDPGLLQRRRDLVHSAALLLDKSQLVRYDRRTGALQGTPLGRIASHYYVSFDSMQTFNELLRPTMGDIDLFRMFSLSKEFSNIVVRQEEKVELAQLADRAPIPIKEGIEEASAKVNLLLQAYISGMRLEGYAMACDLVFIQQSANRLVRAMFEICLVRGWAALAQRCLALANMCEHRIWPTQCFLRQLADVPVGADVLKRIERRGLSVDQLWDLSPQELAELISVGPAAGASSSVKQGRDLHRVIHCFPKMNLSAVVQPITRSTLSIELTLTPDFNFDENLYGEVLLFYVIVEDCDAETILHHEVALVGKRNAGQELSTSFMVPLSDPMPPQYFCRVVCERFLHASTVLPISFRKLILPERFPPPTELLDLRPLAVETATQEAAEALGVTDAQWVRQAYHEVLGARFKVLNAVQTQAFADVAVGDDALLVAAPAGSGKTVLAELSIIRAFATAQDRAAVTCVYVAPLRAVCDRRHAEWQTLFGRELGLVVARLTGDTTADLRALAAANIVIATSEDWDNLSRRWKQRKAVRNVSLFIADQLHLVGSAPGPVLEVVVSRMRFLASASPSLRIVGFSASLANGKEVGAWIGAKKTINLHPSQRPNPVEVELRSFDVHHPGTRLLAMARPVFDAVVAHGQHGVKAALVFVPSTRQAKVTAVDLISFGASALEDEKAVAKLRKARRWASRKHFFVAQDAEQKIAPHLEAIRDPALRSTLREGVAYMHEGMADADRAIVEACFASGTVRTLVTTSDLCWGLRHRADVVVVMDTAKYDGAQGRYLDYPVADLMQMVGRAISLKDVAKCLVFCHSKRKAYYKKFLHDALPVESHLDHVLADHMCAEVVSRVIKNKQEAVDYLTWTLLYRRLSKNPTYYQLVGTSPEILSDYLSELTESTLNELAGSKCIEIDKNEMDVAPLNLGMVASYYYVQYMTIELFSVNLRAQSKLRTVLNVLAAAAEFEDIPVRAGEDQRLENLARHLPLPAPREPSEPAPDYSRPHVKTHILLQLHFSHRALTEDQRADLNLVLDKATRLLFAMVDIIASNRWLRPALAAMELSQMVVQGCWNTDSPLLQIPHFDADILARCTAAGVKHVMDIAELEDDKRDSILQLPASKLEDVAAFCNAYPDLDIKVDVQDATSVRTGGAVRLKVSIERVDDDEDDDEDDEDANGQANEVAPVYGKVVAPRYPRVKMENYWAVVGNAETNELFAIKRVMVGKSVNLELSFDAPRQTGAHQLNVYVMCDSVMGVNEVHKVSFEVREGGAHSDSDSDSDSESGSSSSGSSSGSDAE
ncbi:Activating signal cointegrator 1 complex subunit 3-like [Hondaea fermentalgiana]|uniref:Activating signal cointegrator 1 complex subunit 3-like n=1 Tax=Hondaea fermentalgiana TaxID=2315210 RepID=A0A2R5GY54_9STRA|nr:Activating signal cointegrator 1 complex subunit 3-like [Hondaea fermentalgiana]|eukprot:GBG33653.1 Activating signal cointegrator 1 complex subunit 3-like [Hondaea fermentalgiana]